MSYLAEQAFDKALEQEWEDFEESRKGKFTKENIDAFLQDIKEMETANFKPKTKTKQKGTKTMENNETTANILDTIDFNLDEDVTPIPLMAKGNYPGSIVEAKINNDLGALVIKVTFNGTDALMNDGETEVEGTSCNKRIWLPKPGDENKTTKDGQNLKMWKMRQLQKCLRALGQEANTPQDIAEMLQNEELVGLDVIASVGLNTYKGETTNEIDELVLDIEDPTDG